MSLFRPAWLLLLASVPGWSAIAYVNGIHAAASPSGSATATLTWTPAVGDILVIATSCWNGTAGTCAINSVSDSKSNSYSAVGPTQTHGGSPYIITARFFCAKVTASGTSMTVTDSLTQGTGGDNDVNVAEYSGASCTVDASSSSYDGGTNGTAMTSGAATTTNANDLLVTMGTASQGVLTAGSGWTGRQMNPTGQGEISGYADKIVSSTGSYTATMTNSSSASWLMIEVAFKAASTAQAALRPLDM